MTTKDRLKESILDLLGSQDPEVLISEADKNRLKSLIDELLPYTAVPEPITEQHQVEGVWNSLFASFGAKHSEEKPLRHTTMLGFQSFGKLPMVPVHVTDVHQEIQAATHAYNNVIFVQNEARTANGMIAMRGEYLEYEASPQRYSVRFDNVSLAGADGQGDDLVREQFGLGPEVALTVEFKPPLLHSDIVYLDDDMRINFGSLGGFYVMRKLDIPARSIPATGA